MEQAGGCCAGRRSGHREPRTPTSCSVSHARRPPARMQGRDPNLHSRWLQTQGPEGRALPCLSPTRPLVLEPGKQRVGAAFRERQRSLSAFVVDMNEALAAGTMQERCRPRRRVLSVRDGLSGVPAPRLGAGRLSARAAAAWSRPSVRLFVCLVVCLLGCLFACLLACLPGAFEPFSPARQPRLIL